MKKHSLADMRDLFEADGIEEVLDNVVIDDIDDDELREACSDVIELFNQIKELVEGIEFPEVDDDED